MTLGDALRLVGARDAYVEKGGHFPDLGYALLVFNPEELRRVEALSGLRPGTLVALRAALSAAIGAFTEANSP